MMPSISLERKRCSAADSWQKKVGFAVILRLQCPVGYSSQCDSDQGTDAPRQRRGSTAVHLAARTCGDRAALSRCSDTGSRLASARTASETRGRPTISLAAGCKLKTKGQDPRIVESLHEHKQQKVGRADMAPHVMVY